MDKIRNIEIWGKKQDNVIGVVRRDRSKVERRIMNNKRLNQVFHFKENWREKQVIQYIEFWRKRGLEKQGKNLGFQGKSFNFQQIWVRKDYSSIGVFFIKDREGS